MSVPAALILDCAGTALTAEERQFFIATNPYGFILFERNCENPAQLKALVAEMKACTGRAEVPILIDQEGGRVVRLKPPHWRACPSAGTLVGLSEAAARAVYLNARLIAHELTAAGITVDCAPVADLLVEGAHAVIGDRAYGRNPDTVAHLAGEMARGLLDGGVIPVLKHIPGHGRAASDSHHALPVVDTPRIELEHMDFVPFKKLSRIPMGMTAHVVYSTLDKQRMATTSPLVVHYIRSKIGFDGLLMSDAIDMKAMTGSFAQRAKDVLEAGCDIVLCCNQPIAEQREVAAAVAPMTLAALARSKKAFSAAARRRDEDFSPQAAEAELQALLRRAA